MHVWGDDNVDWKGIDDAASFIAHRLLFWRVDVNQWKEKFGTVRVYCYLGLQWWQSLTHPGHVWHRWPNWLKFINYPMGWSKPFGWALRLVNYILVPFHMWLYRDTYRKAVQKWPHLRGEILTAADYPALLRGL